MAAGDYGCMVDIQEKLKDITNCCICVDIYEDPRILTCFHTFCLRCPSETSKQSDRHPGDKMMCPICRQDFAIPSEGLSELPKNFFMHQLMDFAQSTAENKNQIAPAVKTAPDKMIKQINDDLETLSVWSSNASAKKQMMEKQKTELLEAVGKTHVSVINTRDELKRLIDRHADVLVTNLESIMQEKLKEIDAKSNSIDIHLTSLESFQMYCSQVVEKRSASEVCQLVKDMHTRRDQLRKAHKSNMKIKVKTLKVIFTRSNVEEFLLMDNTVGHIQDLAGNNPMKLLEKPSKVEKLHEEIDTLNEELHKKRRAITNLKAIVDKQTREMNNDEALIENLSKQLDIEKAQNEVLKKKNYKMNKDHNKERKILEELQVQAEKFKKLIDAEWKENETLRTAIAKISKELDKEKIKCTEIRLQAEIQKNELDDKTTECDELHTTIIELHEKYLAVTKDLMK